MAIYLRVNELTQVGQLLTQWESITGMRVSVPKSSLLPLGNCLKWNEGVVVTDGRINVLPEGQQYSYMGAHIGHSWKESSYATWGQIADKVDELVGQARSRHTLTFSERCQFIHQVITPVCRYAVGLFPPPEQLCERIAIAITALVWAREGHTLSPQRTLQEARVVGIPIQPLATTATVTAACLCVKALEVGDAMFEALAGLELPVFGWTWCPQYFPYFHPHHAPITLPVFAIAAAARNCVAIVGHNTVPHDMPFHCNRTLGSSVFPQLLKKGVVRAQQLQWHEAPWFEVQAARQMLIPPMSQRVWHPEWQQAATALRPGRWVRQQMQSVSILSGLWGVFDWSAVAMFLQWM